MQTVNQLTTVSSSTPVSTNACVNCKAGPMRHPWLTPQSLMLVTHANIKWCKIWSLYHTKQELIVCLDGIGTDGREDTSFKCEERLSTRSKVFHRSTSDFDLGVYRGISGLPVCFVLSHVKWKFSLMLQCCIVLTFMEENSYII